MKHRSSKKINIGTLLRPIKITQDHDTVIIGMKLSRMTKLTHDAVNHLIVHLHRLSTIATLKLINCDISGSLLARLIKEASLKTVILDLCPFNDQETLQLAYQLQSTSALKKLEIINGEMGDIGVLALLVAFEMQCYKEISISSTHRLTSLGHEALQNYQNTMHKISWMNYVAKKPFTLNTASINILPIDAREIMQVYIKQNNNSVL